MDIVDGQFHLTPGKTDAMFGAMDALGITSVLLEEYWFDPADHAAGVLQPGYPLENGAWRAVFPNAELASILNPERVSFYVRVDRRDPRLESVMRILGDSPFARGYRVLPTWTPDEAQVFASGGYDEVFAIAEDVGMPICLVIPGWVHHLPRYLERYPDLTFVVDHCGIPRVDDDRRVGSRRTLPARVLRRGAAGGRAPERRAQVGARAAAVRRARVSLRRRSARISGGPSRRSVRIGCCGPATRRSSGTTRGRTSSRTSATTPSSHRTRRNGSSGARPGASSSGPQRRAQSMAEPESTDSVQPVMISESGPTR